MKQQTNRLRRASALLLAAAALPFTPLLAQETPAPDAPVVDITPPPAPSLPPPTVEADMPAPATVTPPVVTTTSPRLAPAPITESTEPPRTRVRAAAPARPRPTAPASDPAPAAPADPAPGATVDAAPTAEALPVAGAPLPAAEPEALPVDTAEAAPATQTGGGSILPWLIGGLLLAGALFLLLRRRRKDEFYEENEPAEYAPAMATAAEPAPLLGVPLAAPLASTAADEPVEAAPAVAAAASETGRPWLDLSVKPHRAGVTGQDAVVEFELDVENHGSAAAEDVRISTWMFPAGSSGETEMERMLIDRSDTSDSPILPETTIEAGAGKRIETAVALSTAGLADDAVLPVVVAEARYRLPDGSEGRTSARFAVGVPDGEELAHFATENPSGLHDDVEARPLGDLERV